VFPSYKPVLTGKKDCAGNAYLSTPFGITCGSDGGWDLAEFYCPAVNAGGDSYPLTLLSCVPLHIVGIAQMSTNLLMGGQCCDGPFQVEVTE
jgi:hypothetical protein